MQDLSAIENIENKENDTVNNSKSLSSTEKEIKIAEKELGIKGWIITPESYLKYPDGA